MNLKLPEPELQHLLSFGYQSYINYCKPPIFAFCHFKNLWPIIFATGGYAKSNTLSLLCTLHYHSRLLTEITSSRIHAFCLPILDAIHQNIMLAKFGNLQYMNHPGLHHYLVLMPS
jgi:hypothetical protein